MKTTADVPAALAALSAPVRRFVALGLVVSVAAAAWTWLYQPVLRWSASKVERLADARFELERLRATSQSLSGVSPEAVQADEGRLKAFLMPGETEAEAMLALQSTVSRLLGGPGLAVEAMRVEGIQDLAGLKALSLSWRGNGEEQALAQALAQLETATPILRVDRIALRAAGGDKGVTLVFAEIRVSGYWTGPAGLAGKAVAAPAAGTTTR
jgi:hypothetical protein